MPPELRIRPEGEDDRTGIRALHLAAFGRPDEADLVERLRRDDDLVLGLVATSEPTVAGHVAFSRLHVGDGVLKATALAPLSVTPDWRGRGVGGRLVREALDRLSESEDLVLVFGDPVFYGPLGFSRDAAAGLRTPYDGPYQLARPLSRAGREAEGEVRYPAAFTMLS